MKTKVKKSVTLSLRTIALIERYRVDNNMTFSEAANSIILQKEGKIAPEKKVRLQEKFNQLKERFDAETLDILSEEIDNLWQM